MTDTQIPPAGPLNGHSRAWLRANLIRLADLARELSLAITTISSWKDRYEGFPEPVVPPDQRHSGAVYWRPDLERFMADNDLPDERYLRPGRASRPRRQWTVS